jgi:hypothetical protein
MIAQTIAETIIETINEAETHPPLEIFCPYCQPNLSMYAQFPQTAKRKMKQVVFRPDDGYTSITYSCEDCIELQATRWDGIWHIRTIENNGHNKNRDELPQDYQQYLKRVFGKYELMNELANCRQ